MLISNSAKVAKAAKGSAKGVESDFPHQQWLELGNDSGRCSRACKKIFERETPKSMLEAKRYSSRKGPPLGSEAFKAQAEAQLEIKLGTGKAGRPINQE